MPEKRETLTAKIDSLLVHTTKLGERQDAMLKRMGDVEKKAEKMEKFIDNCTMGRRVILWLLSGVGTIAGLVIAAYAAWLKS